MALLTNNCFLDLLAIPILCLVSIALIFQIFFLHWKIKGVYSLKPTFPFGTAKELIMQKRSVGVDIKNAYDIIKSKGKKFGGYYFFMRPILVMVDLDLIRNIMITDFQHFTDHVLPVNEEYDPLSSHLFALKGKRWKDLRIKFTPTFTSGKIKMMFPTILNSIKDLIESIDEAIENKREINIKEFAGKYTINIMGNCGFGIECNSFKDPTSKIFKNVSKYFDPSLKDSIVRLLSWTTPELLTYFKIRSMRKDMTEFFTNIVDETINYRETNKIIRKDFMHLLLQIKNNVKISDDDTIGYFENTNRKGKNIQNLTRAEIAAQCFVFFTGGFETSSSLISFLLYELSLNFVLQHKVKKEIKKVLEQHNNKIAYDAIMKMSYLDKCIYETLRKYPSVPVHTRECTKDYTIPNTNVTLKKGSSVFIPVLGIHRDPEYYPDPDKFDPERFSEEMKNSRHPSSWMPFGDGPRTCIAFRFGLVQSKVALVNLLSNYTFSLNSKTRTPLEIDPKQFVLTSTTEIWLNAKRDS